MHQCCQTRLQFRGRVSRCAAAGNVYNEFAKCADYDQDADYFSSKDIQECANLIWDCDPQMCFDRTSLPARLSSNDLNEAKRPDGCGPTDSGPGLCPSQLPGSINFLLEEFGTPTGSSP